MLGVAHAAEDAKIEKAALAAMIVVHGAHCPAAQSPAVKRVLNKLRGDNDGYGDDQATMAVAAVHTMNKVGKAEWCSGTT
jgi:hypothetical protein